MESNPKQTNFTKPFFTIALLRRCLLIVVGLATLIAAFYAVEDWRGKRAWAKCKSRYEAQGYIMDWNALIPPRLPDGENFYKAPQMSEWIVGRKPEFANLLKWPEQVTNNPLVAIIQVVTPGAAHPGMNDAVIHFDDANAASKAFQFVEKLVGPTTVSTRDFTYITRLPDTSAPPVLYVESASTLDGPAIANLFGKKAIYTATSKGGGLTAFRVEPAGPNSFRLFPNNVVTRDAYVTAAANAEKYLNYVREALKRPYARPDGNYEIPAEVPIPNFVAFRTIAQLVGDGAKLDIAAGNSSAALEKLTFIHKLCEVLEGRPTRKPMTLVAAMINVAIQGLYCDMIAEGTQRHAWNDAQLRELQQQTKEINVLPFVESAIEGERISMGRTLQSPKKEIANLFMRFSGPIISDPFSQTNAWDRWQNPLYVSIRLAPRGWFYQNMVTIADTMQPIIEVFDIPKDQISPKKAAAAAAAFNLHDTPYEFIAGIAIPNFIRATQVTARNQSFINFAYLACALERYHLTHNEYPETLDALVPQFADHIPHDIINGQPLHYHLTENGQFKLYSVAWNEKDDAGTPSDDNNTGDWVWRYPLF